MAVTSPLMNCWAPIVYQGLTSAPRRCFSHTQSLLLPYICHTFSFLSFLFPLWEYCSLHHLDPLPRWFLFLLQVRDQTVPSVGSHLLPSWIWGSVLPGIPCPPWLSLSSHFLVLYNVIFSFLVSIFPRRWGWRGWGSLMCSLLYLHGAWQPYSRHSTDFLKLHS